MAKEFQHEEHYHRSRYLASVVNGRFREAFMRDPNILGSAFGRRIVGGDLTDQPAAVVYVARKVSEEYLPPSRLLPRRAYVGHDWIDVDVVETGPIYPLSFTAHERPAPSGISITRFLDSPMDAGTLGALVTDLSAKEPTLAILSCNHVLANENAGAAGDVIVQQGTLDGGTSPADDIAKLTRFVTINATGNVVDCAIATVNNSNDVVNQMKNNLMAVPTVAHPAVGLLFAGGCNRTYMNPIGSVLSQLNVQFASGPGATVAATVGMHVEKVGRTTEYTTSTILEIDASITIPYNFGNATFDHQISTAWLSSAGDSGSVICQGGAGGNEDHCGSGGGCGAQSAVQSLLGVDLGLDASVEKEFRHRYLQHTRIGRYAINTYFRNESAILRRFHETRVEDEDRKLLRGLYEKYGERIRAGLLRPDADDRHFEANELREIRDLLGRAKKYLRPDEAQAADELYELLAPRAERKTMRELLEVLNEEELFKHVRRIVSKVKSLRPGSGRDHDDDD